MRLDGRGTINKELAKKTSSRKGERERKLTGEVRDQLWKKFDYLFTEEDGEEKKMVKSVG